MWIFTEILSIVPQYGTTTHANSEIGWKVFMEASLRSKKKWVPITAWTYEDIVKGSLGALLGRAQGLGLRGGGWGVKRMLFLCDDERLGEFFIATFIA